MARKMLTSLDLVQNELQNARVQNLSSAPGSPVKGQMYMNSSDNTLYWYDGTAWQAAKSGTPAAHAASHNFGGGDAIAANGAVGTPTLRKLGTGATDAAAGDHAHALSYGSVVSEATFGGSAADGVASTLARSDHKHANPLHDAAAHSTIPLNALATAAANYAMGGFKITGLPISGAWSASDAVSKAYVDSVASGLDPKPSARAATTANITLSGQQTIDGQALVDGDICLVKNQTLPQNNGLYWVSVTTWTRLNEMDSWGEVISAFCFVEQGSTQADTGWTCTADVGGVMGTTAINWVQFSGPGTVTAGAGMTQAGNVLNVIAADASLVVGADNVAVAFGGNGSAVSAARSDHTHTANARVFSQGTAAGLTTAIAHGLNTRDVDVAVYRNSSPWDTVDCDVERTDTANILCRFNVATASNEYRIVVTG